LVVPM